MSKLLVGLAIAGSFGGGYVVSENSELKSQIQSTQNAVAIIESQSEDAIRESAAIFAERLKEVDERILVISRNISNTNTTAYKKEIPGRSLIRRDFREGSLEQTGRPFDLAIREGDGWFQIQLFDGRTGYTRDGSFEVNADGEMVDSNGNRLFPVIAIHMHAMDISVAPNGTVSGILPGAEHRTVFGQIHLATFANQGGLVANGGNVFLASVQSGAPNECVPGENHCGQIVQEALESSNVDLCMEYVNYNLAIRDHEVATSALSQLVGKDMSLQSTRMQMRQFSDQVLEEMKAVAKRHNEEAEERMAKFKQQRDQ